MKLLLDIAWASSVGGEAAQKSCCSFPVSFADLQQRQLIRDIAVAQVSRLLQEASGKIFQELLLLGSSGACCCTSGLGHGGILLLSALAFFWLLDGCGLPLYFDFS